MLWLASRSLLLTLHEHAPNLAGVLHHRPAPAPKASLHIHGLRPFVQIAALHLVLFRILALGFQHKVIAVLESQQEIRAILAHNPAIDVKHFKAEVVIAAVSARLQTVIITGGVDIPAARRS